MTSEERKEARYQRRKAKRRKKLREYVAKNFDDVMSFGNLCKAGKASCNGSRWKTSTILFENNLLSCCCDIRNSLIDGTRKFKGFQSFTTIEHGKARNIDALPIKERAIQKCLCNNLLEKVLSRSFVYDNGASLKNKGMDFMLRRLKKHLADHYRKHGTNGAVYQFDFKNYFGSIPHDEIKSRMAAVIEDERLYALMCSFVDDFLLMRTADRTAEKKHGVGLGSEISQIIALDYANPIDHYIKDVCGIKGYGRYMDDGYIISDSIEKLKEIRCQLYKLAENLGLKMSDKKNIITPLRHHCFTFLKMRINLSESGKVTMRLSRKSIRSIRRKLDIFRKWLDEGKMGTEDIFQSYQSWRAHAKRCNSYGTLKSLDVKFVRLFSEELRVRKKKFPCTLKATKTTNGWKYVQKEEPL